MRPNRLFAAVVSVLFVAGCAGHSAGIPIVPGVPTSNAFTVAQHVTPGDGDATATAEIDLPVEAAAAKQVAVVGAVYPSYASSIVGNNTQIITPHGKVLSAVMSFTGLPRANNEWAVVAFYKYALDGSTVFIGDEAALLNVNKPVVHVKVNVSTTQIFQAAMALINAGLVNATDLSTSPKFPALIAKEVTKAHLKPQKTTGLFTPAQLQTFVQKETNAWQRTLTIEGGATSKIISVTNDTSLAGEGFLSSNTRNFLGTASQTAFRPAGAPCGNAVPTHVPGTNPTPAPISCATI